MNKLELLRKVLSEHLVKLYIDAGINTGPVSDQLSAEIELTENFIQSLPQFLKELDQNDAIDKLKDEIKSLEDHIRRNYAFYKD
jgi:hypothetical protein